VTGHSFEERGMWQEAFETYTQTFLDEVAIKLQRAGPIRKVKRIRRQFEECMGLIRKAQDSHEDNKVHN
jgi:hypothetical protein